MIDQARALAHHIVAAARDSATAARDAIAAHALRLALQRADGVVLEIGGRTYAIATEGAGLRITASPIGSGRSTSVIMRSSGDLVIEAVEMRVVPPPGDPVVSMITIDPAVSVDPSGPAEGSDEWN